MAESNNVCEYVTLLTPGIDERTRLTLEAVEVGWVYAGGVDEAKDWFWATFQPRSGRVSFVPPIQEVFAALPDPSEGEIISVISEKGIGSLIFYKGRAEVSDTFRAMCAQFINLIEPAVTTADIVNFPEKTS